MTSSQLQNCALLERRIKAASQQGMTLFHPEMRQLRAELRQACEAALFEDYARAQRHELEQLLWKSVFYRPIEEFRRRIKEHTQARNEDILGKTQAAFHLYLEEGRQFYARLAVRLQSTFGYVGFDPGPLAQQAAEQAQQQQQQRGQQQRHDCRASVYRCLLCLGDLARYQVGNAEARQRDWSECKRCYQQAVRVYPKGGNSYNQLAVLASFEQDELATVYYYLRALSVPSPFAVARENLVTLLDSNRATYAKLVASGGGSRGAGAAGRLPQRGVRPAAQLERELRTRWVRLLGMLHLKLDLDAFQDFLAAALADLDDYIQRLRPARGGTKEAPPRVAEAAPAPPLLLQLALCTACIAHGALADHEAHRGAGGSYSDSLQRSVVRGHALTALAELGTRLGTSAAAIIGTAATGGGGGSSAEQEQVLPAAWVLLRWAAGPLPAGAGALVPAGGAGSGAGGAAEQSAALIAALRRFWAAMAQLGSALRPMPVGVDGEPGSTPVSQSLPEDMYCMCFAPLAPGPGDCPQTGGAAAARQPAAKGEERRRLRAQRLLGAAEALAAALGPQEGGPLGAFVAAVSQGSGPAAAQQAQRGAQAHGEPAAAGEGRPGGSLPGQLQQQVLEIDAAQAAADAGLGACGMDVDGGAGEEEVILYQPQASPSPSSSPPLDAPGPGLPPSAAAADAAAAPSLAAAPSAAVPAAATSQPAAAPPAAPKLSPPVPSALLLHLPAEGGPASLPRGSASAGATPSALPAVAAPAPSAAPAQQQQWERSPVSRAGGQGISDEIARQVQEKEPAQPGQAAALGRAIPEAAALVGAAAASPAHRRADPLDGGVPAVVPPQLDGTDLFYTLFGGGNDGGGGSGLQPQQAQQAQQQQQLAAGGHQGSTAMPAVHVSGSRASGAVGPPAVATNTGLAGSLAPQPPQQPAYGLRAFLLGTGQQPHPVQQQQQPAAGLFAGHPPGLYHPPMGAAGQAQQHGQHGQQQHGLEPQQLEVLRALALGQAPGAGTLGGAPASESLFPGAAALGGQMGGSTAAAFGGLSAYLGAVPSGAGAFGAGGMAPSAAPAPAPTLLTSLLGGAGGAGPGQGGLYGGAGAGGLYAGTGYGAGPPQQQQQQQQASLASLGLVLQQQQQQDPSGYHQHHQYHHHQQQPPSLSSLGLVSGSSLSGAGSLFGAGGAAGAGAWAGTGAAGQAGDSLFWQ